MRIVLRLSCLLLGLTSVLPAQPERRQVSDIPVPPGCARIPLPLSSYPAWLRASRLKADLSILTHDGDTVSSESYRVLAVLDRPLLFRDDLEQCADWCFRLWAEYHREAGRLNKLYLFHYNGRRRYFSKSGKTFRSFLRWAMANANSHSLKNGCSLVDSLDLLPGDMLVQNNSGGVGHVSVVMDACADSTGHRYYLLGYGYMPAQEFHLERASPEYGPQGWFDLQGIYQYLRIHFGSFGRPRAYRFP